MELISKALAQKKIHKLEELPWPSRLQIQVLAPHPDDFDAAAVTLRFFKDRGDEIRLAVLSLSPSGVEDSFCRPPTARAKAALREAEQRMSCGIFGLPEDRIVFLRLPEDEAGDPRDNQDNFSQVSSCLRAARPDLVLLPHWNDPNPGHRLAFDMLRRHAAGSDFPIAALLNRDPKTLQMRSDIYAFFSEAGARWKSELLRCHRSQHQRNLNVRGYGFDERILRTNRAAAAEIPTGLPYAEVFEFWTG